MHSGKNFSFKQVIFWTRKDLLHLTIISFIPTFCYEVFGWDWLSIPWLPIALLGTAVAFVVGFKNNASYDRMWEARKAYGAIVNASRSWGIYIKDFISEKHSKKTYTPDEINLIKHQFINRHLA